MSEKRNRWLSSKLQNLHVTEKHSNRTLFKNLLNFSSSVWAVIVQKRHVRRQGEGGREGQRNGPMDGRMNGLVDPLLGLKPLGRLNYDKLDLI